MKYLKRILSIVLSMAMILQMGFMTVLAAEDGITGEAAGVTIHVDTAYAGSDSDGSTDRPYPTIAAALAAVGSSDNCTIKLLSDVSLGSDKIVIGNISLTLDLNGKMLTSANDYTLMYQNAQSDKTLTVTDNSVGTGKIESTGSDDIAIANNAAGKITITGMAMVTSTVSNDLTGTVEISGGTVKTGKAPAVQNRGTGKIIISGNANVVSSTSAIEGSTIRLFGSRTETETADRLVIKGGMVANDGDGVAVWNTSAGGVNISDGTVSGMILNGNTGGIAISGGTVQGGNTSAITSAITSSGLITISDTAKVTSTSDDGSTISLNRVDNSTAKRFVITGGVVENTGSGSAILNNSQGGVEISGGAVIGTGGGEKSIIRIPINGGALTVSGGAVVSKSGTAAVESSGSVSFTGGIIWGDLWGYNDDDTAITVADKSWQVKGSQTLPVDAAIAPTKTLTVPQGASLNIPNGVTLTNSGALTNDGTLTNSGIFKLYGTLSGTGTLGGSGSFTAFGEEDITIPDQLYTGSAITPIPIIAASRGKVMGRVFMIDQSDYTGPNYINNTQAGTAAAVYTYNANSNWIIEKKFNILPVTIHIEPAGKTMVQGETITLQAVIAPAEAAGREIRWSSSNQAVAAVDNAGNVTAAAGGTAVITAVADGGLKAECTITVKANMIPVTAIALNTAKEYLLKGQSIQLKATVDPADATDPSVTWTSSDDKVASVDALGNVTAKARGTVWITAAASNGKTAVCTIIVPELKLNASASVLQVKKSSSAVKTASQYPADDKVASYQSSNTKIVKVDKKGKITASGKTGKATVTVTMISGASDSYKVTVQKGKVTTKKLSLDTGKITLLKGKKASVTAVRTPISAAEKITYSTSNKKVVTVDKKGRIKAVGSGTATITAQTSNGKKAACKVTVPGVTLQKTSASIKTKKTTSIKVKSTVVKGDKVKAYKSSNTKVASVSTKGIVKGIKKGKATIAVTMKSGAAAQFKVTVK